MLHGIGKRLRGQSKGVKASFAYFLASVVSSGIAYITTPIFTRLLTAGQFGQVSVYLTWESVLGIVAMFCLSYGVYNNGMMDYKGDRDGYALSMLALSQVITTVFAVLLLVVYHFAPSVFGFGKPLVFLMLLGFYLQPAYSFWMARQRFEFRYKAPSLFAILLAFASPVTAIIGLMTMDGDPVTIRLFLGKAPSFLVYGAFCILLIHRGQGKVETKYWKVAFLFNLPLIPHYLSSLLLGSADKLMISAMVGKDQTAYYSVAHSVAVVVTIVWSAANASLIPYTYEKCEKKDYHAISRVTEPLLLVFGGLCCSLIFLAPEVVSLMAPKSYQEAVYVIPPIVGGVFFQVQYYIYANILYYYKKPRYVMYASVTAMLLNIGLNYVCISQFGYLAAGYTTLVSYFVQAVLDYVGMKKAIREPVYNMKMIGLLSLGMVMVALASVLLYKQPAWIRYILIVVFGMIGLMKRKTIMDVFHQTKGV